MNGSGSELEEVDLASENEIKFELLEKSHGTPQKSDSNARTYCS